MSEGKGNCRRNSVNYEIKCLRDGCDYVYMGETSQNAYCRGGEHLEGIKKRYTDSVLCQHIHECHIVKLENRRVTSIL